MSVHDPDWIDHEHKWVNHFLTSASTEEHMLTTIQRDIDRNYQPGREHFWHPHPKEEECNSGCRLIGREGDSEPKENS